MPAASIEIVIAVHDPRRPLARALASVQAQRETLRAAGAELRAAVVVHNTEIAPIRDALAPELMSGVRFLELADGIRSPAGPFNAGIDTSEATFVSLLGSDDVLEPCALAAWYARARETRADAVIAALRRGGQVVMTPHLRPGRRRVLHPVADGLAYRTAPLGLLRRTTLQGIGFRLTEGGHLNGEDIEPALRLWFRGGRIAYPYGAPCYRILEDMGAARATAELGPLRRELGFLPPLLTQDWLRAARPAEKTAIGVKLVRAQVIGAIGRRVEARQWTADDARFLARTLQDVRALAGEGLDALSAVETSICEGAGTAHGTEELVAAWERARHRAAPWRVLPRRPERVLAPSSRARIFASQQLAQRTGSFTHPEGVGEMPRARHASAIRSRNP